MNSNNITPIETITSKIIIMRGQKVMLDSDLSDIYGVETRRLNEQVKRNLDRFPGEFMFQLTKEEFENLISQNATSRWGGTRKIPFVFTEHGALMLASVLKSDVATKMSILVVKAFVKLREMLSTHEELRKKLEELESRQGKSEQYIQAIIGSINNMLKEPPSTNKIGFRKD